MSGAEFQSRELGESIPTDDQEETFKTALPGADFVAGGSCLTSSERGAELLLVQQVAMKS